MHKVDCVIGAAFVFVLVSLGVLTLVISYNLFTRGL